MKDYLPHFFSFRGLNKVMLKKYLVHFLAQSKYSIIVLMVWIFKLPPNSL